MGYLHSPLLLMGQAIRKDKFDEFMKVKIADKNYDNKTLLGIIIFEDSEIGGTIYDEIKPPDFSEKEDILKQVEEKSVFEIEKNKKYPSKIRAAVRAAFEKMRTDEALYKAVVAEYERFLVHLEGKRPEYV